MSDRPVVWLAPALAAFVAAACVQAAPCELKALAIEPEPNIESGRFVGRAGTTEVEFTSERKVEPVEVFAEPPMIVRRAGASPKRCEFDGGVWARHGVFINAAGTVVVAQESSGSSDWLVAYDVLTCQRRQVLDVSGSKWRISGTTLQVTASAAPVTRTQTYTLSANCAAQRSR